MCSWSNGYKTALSLYEYALFDSDLLTCSVNPFLIIWIGGFAHDAVYRLSDGFRSDRPPHIGPFVQQ